MDKKTIPKDVITFRTSQKARLEALAEQEDRAVSCLINLAVEEFLARRKGKRENSVERSGGMERSRMAEIALLLDEVDVKSRRYNHHSNAANATVLRQVEERGGLRKSVEELVSWMKGQGVEISADEVIEYCEELSKN